MLLGEHQRNWLLVAALLVASLVRVAGIGADSLWFDEAFSVIASRIDAGAIFRGGADPVLPPFYFLILHVWQALTGESEVAVRLLSAWCSLLAVAIVYRLGNILFGHRAASWAAVAMAMSPFQIYYAQEARPYALSVLLGGAFLWAFAVAWVRRQWLAWASFVGIATAGLYTHYFFVFLLGAVQVFALTQFRSWQRWRALLLADAIIALLFLPHAWTAIQRAQAVAAGFWITPPTLAWLLTAANALLFSPTTHPWLWPIAMFGATALLAVVALDLVVAWRRLVRPFGAYLVLYAVLTPLLSVLIVSLLGAPIYLYRSFALITPALLLLIGLGLHIRPARSPSLYLAGLVGAMAVVSLWQAAGTANPLKPDFRSAAAVLTTDGEPSDVLLNLRDSSYFSMQYYVPGIESFVLETDQESWLQSEAWQRFGRRISFDGLKADHAGDCTWLIGEPQLLAAPQWDVIHRLQDRSRAAWTYEPEGLWMARYCPSD